MSNAIDRAAFVGTATFTASQLQAFLKDLPYCFQRWPHCVRWQASIEQAFSPIGQAFNADRELRWQQQGDCYSVLLLSITALESEFVAIGKGWHYRDRPAHFYPSTETRFARSLQPPDINIAQRYFIDARTAAVQFVALTLQP